MTLWTTLCDAPWVERLGWTLIHSVWQIALVGLACGLVLTLLSHRSANLRYLAGCAALVLMVGLPTTTFLWLRDGTADARVVAEGPGVVEAPGVELTPPSPTPIEPRRASAPTAPFEPTGVSLAPVTTPDAGAAVEAVDRFARLRAVMPWLVAGWLLGVVVLSVRPLWGLLTVRRLRRSGRSALPERLQRTARELAARFRLRRAVEFVQSTLVEVPAVVGCFRPIVLLPASAISGLSIRELEMIIAHELAHVRRHDYLVNLLQTVIETLFFYHPAAWWVSRQVRKERENCCDDAALAVCGDRATYARALAGLAEQRVLAASVAPTLRGGSLLERIRRLAGRSPDRAGIRRPGAWLTGALLLSCVVAPVGLDAFHRGAVLASEPPGLQRLIEQLSSEDPAEVDAAVDDLVARGPGVAQDMIPLLETGRTDRGATRVLKRLAGDRQVQEVLLEALDSTSPNTRHCALIALGSSGNEAHVDRIAEMLDRPPHPIAAIVALEEIGGDRAVARLIECLETVDRQWLFLAARALGDLHALEAVVPLEDMLRKIGADSAEEYPRSTVPAIIRALQDIQKVQGIEAPRITHQFCQGKRFEYPFQSPGLMKTFSVSETRDAFIKLPEVDPATESGRKAIYQTLVDKSRPNSVTMDGTRLLAFGGLELAPLPPIDRLTEGYREHVETVARMREARQWANTHQSQRGPIDGIRVYPIEEKVNRFLGRTTDGQLALVKIERTTDDYEYRVTFSYIDPHYELLLAADRAESPATAVDAEPIDRAVRQAKKAQTARRVIRIRVVQQSGKAVPGAKIHVSVWTKEPFDRNRDFVCDAQGETEAELPRSIDILRLWARADGYVPLFAHWESDELQGDGSRIPEEFTFKLQKGTVVGGVVKNEDGQPIAGAKVEVKLRVGGEQERNRTCFSTWLAEGEDARITDAQGRWTLDNVPAGDDVELTLRLSHPDYISDYHWGVMQKHANVTTASLREQTSTIVMARGISVTGSVTDPTGKPVTGAVVVWGDDPYFMGGSQEVRTDERGAYRFPPLPPMPVTLTVMARGWAPELKKTTIKFENPPVDFQLKPGKTLRLRFVDDSGKPVPEVGVGIAGWRGGKSLYNHKHPNVLDTKIPAKADKNGVYEWNWAPPDHVEYNFWKEGYRSIRAEPYTADGVEHEVRLSR